MGLNKIYKIIKIGKLFQTIRAAKNDTEMSTFGKVLPQRSSFVTIIPVKFTNKTQNYSGQ